ncbi:MAG: cation:proton antiporter [Thermoplasmatota archaeon]
MIFTIEELPIINVMLLIAIALIFARVFAYIFDVLKQPAVIGEIAAGIILGFFGLVFFNGQSISFFSFSFSLPNLDYQSMEFSVFANLGILFLLFISGLETSIKKLKKMGSTSSLVAAGGIIVPLLFGIGTALLLGFQMHESVIIGLILIATSVGITVRTLMDIHVLDTDAGAAILGSAVIDDVFGLVLLAFFLGTDTPLYVGLKVIIFFVIFLYIGLLIFDKILFLGEKIRLPKAFLSIILALFLLYSFFAESLGVAGIIGAFFAGLIIGNNLKNKKLIEDVKTIGYGFFIPLFFVWIGASIWSDTTIFNLSSLATIVLIAVIIIFIAIIGKIVGCGIGAKISGMTNKESLQVGIGMIPRMELALIIVSSAISYNILTGSTAHQILLVTILLTLVTTLITPFLLKYAFID